jgi:hypothetical protein
MLAPGAYNSAPPINWAPYFAASSSQCPRGNSLQMRNSFIQLPLDGIDRLTNLHLHLYLATRSKGKPCTIAVHSQIE